MKNLLLVFAIVTWLTLPLHTEAQSCVTIDGAWTRWPAESSAVDTINGIDGALFNGASYTPGVVGQAFLFDGPNAYFQASVPYLPTSVNGISSDKTITIELWMRMDASAPAVGAWVAGYNDPNSIGFISALALFVGADQRLTLLGPGVQGPTVELGRWYHVAGVYDGVNAKLYVDGALVGSVATFFAVGSGPFYMGQYAPGYFYDSANKLRFRGAVDEPTIFMRALSAEEVQSIYLAGSAGKCRSLNNPTPAGTCEVIAPTVEPKVINVVGLAFGPQNEPVVAWNDPGVTRTNNYLGCVMWASHANGSWGTPTKLDYLRNSNTDRPGFALREDGHPFFVYGAQVPGIGVYPYQAVYMADAVSSPEPQNHTLVGWMTELTYWPNAAVAAFAPGANAPDWVFWHNAGPALYNGVLNTMTGSGENQAIPPGWDFAINSNGVHALLFNRFSNVQLSQTPGSIDGPSFAIIDGRNGNVAVAVDGNNVFHALVSGLYPDADHAPGKMIYARSTDGVNWVKTDLGLGMPFLHNRAVGMAMDPRGLPALAYLRLGKLWYATLEDGHWAQTAVGTYSGYSDSHGGSHFRLAFDRTGQPAIAIFDPGTTNILLCRPGAVRHPPVAISQDLTTPEDTPLTLTLGGTDPDGDILTLALVSTPAHGTLSGTAPDLTYTPAANYVGADSFQFQVTDRDGASQATISITVTPVNDPPIANPQTLSTPEDTSLPITLTASDVDDETLTITSVGTPAHGTLNGTAPNLTYSPAPNYNGPDSFTFTVTDAANATSTATISIIVTPVNDPPIADPQTLITPEDTPLLVTLTGSEIDGDALAFSVISPPAHGTLNGVAPNLTYTPAEDYNGPDGFAFEVDDGRGGTATAAVSIEVTPVNDPPVARDDSALTAEDTSVNIDVLANDSDVDGDTLMVIGVTQGAHGTVIANLDGTVNYTPNANFNGADSFSYTISDGQGGEVTAAVAVTVTPVNDDPSPVDDNATTPEDTPIVIDVLANDSDADGDALVIQTVTQGAHGTVVINGDGSVIFSPELNFNGNDSFTYTVSDGQGGSGTATVFVTVTPVNDPPVASDSTATGEEDAPVELVLLATDADGDALTFTIVTPPLHGSLSEVDGNRVIYTPAADYSGPDSLTFRASDGRASDDGVVTINVVPINDPPVLDPVSDQTVNEGQLLTFTLTATDLEGDTLTFSSPNLPAGATLDSLTGAFSWTPNFAQAGTYSVTFTVSDPSGVPDSKTITVTVVDVPQQTNRDPDCSLARPSIGEIWPPNHKQTVVIEILGVTDPDGDPVSITVTKVLQDEPTNTLGDGDTWVDGGGIGTARAWVRAERSGTPRVPGNGRVYQIFFTATDGKGGTCSSSVKVGVPHDQDHKPAIDDGVRYDSTAPGGPRVN